MRTALERFSHMIQQQKQTSHRREHCCSGSGGDGGGGWASLCVRARLRQSEKRNEAEKEHHTIPPAPRMSEWKRKRRVNIRKVPSRSLDFSIVLVFARAQQTARSFVFIFFFSVFLSLSFLSFNSFSLGKFVKFSPHILSSCDESRYFSIYLMAFARIKCKVV